nr:reverse transcriptase domain-containing protein [Tanacetum cinerariifolium]
SSSKLSRDQTSNPTSSTNPTPKGHIHRSSKQKVENSNFEENLPPEVPMAENQTMAQLLQAPTEDKMPADCLKIIDSKSKVRQTRAKAVVAKVNSSSSTPAISSNVAELKDMVRALLLDKKNQYLAPTPSPTPALIKAVKPNCVTCGGSGTLPGNTITNPKEDLKGITTRSDVAYQGPTIPTQSKVAKPGTEVTKDQVQTPNSQSTSPVQPTVIQSESESLVSEPVVAPVSALMLKLKPSIPYPSRRNNERCRMDECLALADLGASINLMPLSVWKGLSLPELTPTCMTLELADRTESKPIGIAKDVKVKVGMFHFPADFVIVDFEPDLRVPLILGRYSANYDQMTANKIDVTDEACEEYSQEVLGFFDVTASGSPTPSDDPIVSTTSPTLTPFEDSDFLLFEEADAFLGLEDDSDSPKLDPSYYDPEGDILLLEAILNSDPSPPLSNHEQSVPSFKNELKACEAKTIKSSIDEPPEVELKDLPPHLEYAFLEGDNKLPIIIAKELRDEEKSALIKVLKSHKRAIAWKLSDIHEVEKLLDAGLIYPIFDSPWVSSVHCVPKKCGFTVVANEENELIPTRLVTGWRENTTFTCPYGTFTYRRMPCGLCNAPGTFQRCMLAIFHDMVEKTMEVFMDDFSVFGNSFENTLSHLDKMLQSAYGSFRLKVSLCQKGCQGEIALLGSAPLKFDFDVIDTKGAGNLAADHLSRLENPYENVLDPKEIDENFPLETLSMVTFHGDSGAPWFADFANYHAGNFIVKGMSTQQKNKFFKDVFNLRENETNTF